MSAKNAPQKEARPIAAKGLRRLKRLIEKLLLRLKRILSSAPGTAKTRPTRLSAQTTGAECTAAPVPSKLPDKPLSAYPESLFEPAVLPADVEAQLKTVDWTQRDVLIGTLRNAAQLKACLDHAFYYIPAPLVTEDDLPIRCVALFQTPRIFPGNAGIFCYGEVQHCALVRRGSIREVPQTHGSPADLYYRYQIRRWTFLPRPILPKEAGFVRAFTNLFLLENAEYIPELLLCSEMEYRFYTELKRRAKMARTHSETASGFALGDICVLLAGEKIRVFQDGMAVSSCTVREFSQRPGTTLRMLLSQRAGDV